MCLMAFAAASFDWCTKFSAIIHDLNIPSGHIWWTVIPQFQCLDSRHMCGQHLLFRIGNYVGNFFTKLSKFVISTHNYISESIGDCLGNDSLETRSSFSGSYSLCVTSHMTGIEKEVSYWVARCILPTLVIFMHICMYVEYLKHRITHLRISKAIQDIIFQITVYQSKT